MARIDELADRLQHRVYRQVLENPEARARVVGRSVRRVRAEAVRAGQESMEPKRLRRLRSFLAAERFTVEQQDERSLLRRAAASRGAIFMPESGRWMRPVNPRFQTGGFVIGGTRYTYIPSTMDLVQRRVRAANTTALKAAGREARKLGVKAPNGRKRDPWKSVDPRVKAAYARRLALECSRIAHDAILDDYRDAAFDRADQLGVGWRRECEATACGACLALADGAVHPPGDRTFYRHTRCRCRPVPATQRVRTGQEIFDSLTGEEQDRLFHGRGGAAKAQLLRDGRVSLADLVTIATDRLDATDYVIGETPLEGLPVAPDD